MFVVIPIIAIVIIFTVKGVVNYTSRSEFCNKCHVMKNYYSSWAKSAHGDVACYKCHTDSGVIGQLKAKINGIRELFITVAKIDVKLQDQSAYKRCIICHNNFVDITPKNLKIFKHIKHLKTEYSCGRCHVNLVHSQGFKFSMKFCLGCHKSLNKGRAPVDNCIACHS